MKKIKRESKKYKYNGPLTFPTITLVEEEIKKASEAYNKFRPRAYEAHMTHKEKLANEIAIDSGPFCQSLFFALLFGVAFILGA